MRYDVPAARKHLAGWAGDVVPLQRDEYVAILDELERRERALTNIRTIAHVATSEGARS